jgi:hypothetical protein
MTLVFPFLVLANPWRWEIANSPFFAYIEGKRGGKIMIQGGNDRKSFNSIFVTEIVTLYIRIELHLPPSHIPISFFSLISIYLFFP